jgi:hypothetical protein
MPGELPQFYMFPWIFIFFNEIGKKQGYKKRVVYGRGGPILVRSPEV